jgi:CDP-diacylglycerol--serine O-phosphatidyltransferase
MSNPTAGGGPDDLPQDKFAADEFAARPRGKKSRHRRSRQQRRLRLRRHGRRAYIRSVYFLPSLATLGNAVCGFAAMYVAASIGRVGPSLDPLANFLLNLGMSAPAYLIFMAMVFDALDGRLARFARHTTDFGGQLDSLADVVSFGAAPAFLAIRLFKLEGPDIGIVLSRLVWSAGAMYLSCAAVRLARFNVSNEHGEQHHFSFLGLPSPGAAGAVAALVLMQQELKHENDPFLSEICLWILPMVVLACGLLMVSHVRYPHLVNRYLRGRRSIGRLILVLAIALLLIVAHQYTLGVGTLAYAAWGPLAWIGWQLRRRGKQEQGPPRQSKPV